ncbi:undecaprenyldiphospho-muramoylpentapeptide beta-N-acetylglucosaminyltransferase [uncultured Apibacter sp.]|uniref:undecaprenyldiphospho-muramoylpentapeptide beta-N-acetylglucosaminyltransferase n=1 Tax=uncultured Apibacter sp. TaxID=1778616 RepID=UPI0025FE4B6C|nr:undecaprenyldiphospho-muramoylpentapeptide beta-N-acetylglucosaminyltransferase [uncultured Apibacter sp.]
MKSPRFLLSGGGTGGHIFPAIAIADEIKRRLPNAEFLFIGSEDKMEMEKVPQAGYKIEGLWISGISRSSMLANLKFPFKVFSSILKSRKIIKSFKPDAAIGTGGYASGPALYVAANTNIPTFIQEQNSFPGITNKKLANKTKGIFVAYNSMDMFFPKEKIHFTGNPVRKSLFNNKVSQEQAKKELKLDFSKLVILSIGGSLGSRTINNFWKNNSKIIADSDIQILWQTGKSDYSDIINNSELKHPNIQITEFIKNMSLAYAAADIIISRAGAIAISELTLAGKPTILIPFPYAAEDHQTKNALQLVNYKAAKMVKDSDVSSKLLEEIQNLISNANERELLGENILKMAKPNATEEIVSHILKELNFE